jgi:hypothetical protein
MSEQLGGHTVRPSPPKRRPNRKPVTPNRSDPGR